MNKKFYFGFATSAAQIEGAYLDGGRTPSIWDNIKEIKDKSNCHTSCDFYHNYKSDIALFKSLKINSFRFSISWSRIFPSKGKINEEGIKFYNDLINELISNDIEPFVTLYHWDLPEWVNKLGGFENEEIINLFEEFATICSQRFSDRVKYWFVYNEPQIFLTNGYFKGTMPPFKKLTNIAEITMIALKAHKKAVDALRKNAKQKIYVGIAFANSIYIPSSNSSNDIEKAKMKTFDSYNGKLWNCWYSDPLVANKAIKLDENNEISEEDLKEIYSPLDFVGINYYAPCADEKYKPLRKYKTQMDWYVDERGMYWVLKYYYERYKLPLIISENGFAIKDNIIFNNIFDYRRSHYIKKYIEQLNKAKAEGVDVFGYLYWSAIDNFEWLEGYRPKFGLIAFNKANQKRIVKKSALTFKKIIECSK